jgi:mannose-6-phosphate isomerase-like protein (cupin superfamily)
MAVRRVVTGHTTDGKAIVASDELIEPITIDLAPGAEFLTVWGADEAPTFPDAGQASALATYFPPLGGFRFGMFTVPPATAVSAADFDIEAALGQMEARLPGLAGHMEPENPGMHTTDTVDYEFVVSGEIVLELDDGVKVHLKPGDTVVQNGTRHAWRNEGTEPCTMVLAIVGAERR